MAGTKEIKRRIKSIKNIGQITKALEMISAVKMRKAQASLAASAAYFSSMEEIFLHVLADTPRKDIEQLLGEKRKHPQKQGQIALVIIAPTKGFAGGLLSHLTEKTLEFIQKRTLRTPFQQEEFIVFHEDETEKNQTNDDTQIDIQLVTVEKKSKDFAIHLQKEVLADFPKLSSPPVFEDVVPISIVLLDEFKAGTIDEIYVVYTHFVNTFTQKAVVKRILPFQFEAIYKQIEQKKRTVQWYDYDEDKFSLFNAFYPTYIDTLLYHAVLDAAAAEHSARMIAMKNATDNALDLRKELVFTYNQRRQASITQEILEITTATSTL